VLSLSVELKLKPLCKLSFLSEVIKNPGMKLILSLSLLLGFLQWIKAAEHSTLDDMAGAMYRKALERATAFFQTAGTPVVNNAHPSLRTEAVLHERGTAHFTIYKDADCTQLDHILDLKINHCSQFMHSTLVTIEDEIEDTYKVRLQTYDESCTTPVGSPSDYFFEKFTCYQSPVGGYTMFNVRGNPKKSIPGGGGAFVFYDNYYDCHISKHTNLGRSQMVITWPFDECATGFEQHVKADSCDAVSFKYRPYGDDSTCTSTMSPLTEISTNPAVLNCPTTGTEGAFSKHYQVRCITAEPI
jgi:hypothetical protein